VKEEASAEINQKGKGYPLRSFMQFVYQCGCKESLLLFIISVS
jgi:hypothetical protein